MLAVVFHDNLFYFLVALSHFISFLQDKILRGLPSDDMGDLFKKTPRNSSQAKEGGTPSMKTRGEIKRQKEGGEGIGREKKGI